MNSFRLSASKLERRMSQKDTKKRMLKIHMGDFLKISTSEKFDLIISNPPYFTHSLRAADPIRNAARHDDLLPSDAFMKHSKGLLRPEGRVALIFPKSEF